MKRKTKITLTASFDISFSSAYLMHLTERIQVYWLKALAI
jgi:hypothetical protein